MKNYISLWIESFSKKYSLAPLELKFFIVFCVCVTVLSLTIQLLMPNSIEESIIPITGWNMGMAYGFCLIVTLGSMVSRRGIYRKLTAQYGNILLLAVFVVFHLIDLLTWTGGYEDNPYLFRSPWRPVWTIVVPVLWIILLLSPRIKKYYRSLMLENAVN